MELEEVIEKIDKHIKLNEAMAMVELLKGDNEECASHIGAMTGLEILKKDLKGEVDL